MINRDLDNLKDLPVPAPRADAKRAAMEAALEAFDSTNPETSLAPQGDFQGVARGTKFGEILKHRGRA